MVLKEEEPTNQFVPLTSILPATPAAKKEDREEVGSFGD
jgi:hypothetical protein